MANAVYDPETENQHGYDPQTTPKGDSSDPRDDLRGAEAGGLYNPNDDSRGEAVSPDDLKNSEEAGEDPDSLYNPHDRKSRLQRAKSRLRSLMKKKWLVGFGAGGAILAILIILLLILLGSFKIIQLGEHIAAYQFARATRNYSENVNQITAEDTALSTADRNTVQRAYDQFSAVKDKTWGSMWDHINNYRPDKIVENMKTNGKLDFEYERGGITSLWKKRLTAIIVDGKTIPVSNPSLFDRYFHPLQTRRDRLAVSDEANFALAEAMQDRSSIIRGAVAKAIRDEYGINLQWWKQLTKYRGANSEKAAALTEAEAEAEINKSVSPAPSSVSQVSQAEQDAQSALDSCMADTACLNDVVNNNGKLPNSVIDKINAVVSANIFQKALSFINMAYTIGLPVCLVYDGSLQSGKGQAETIDNTNAQYQRSYYAVETAGDQQKYGNTTGEAVGGMSWKTGDTSKSIPELRAGGVKVNTANEISPQASTTNQLGNTVSIFSFLPSPASDLANSLAPTACNLVTNIWTGAIIGIGNLIAGFFSGDTSTIAEEGLAQALKSYLSGFASQLFTKKEAAKLGIFVAGTEGLTLLAKMLVAQKSGVSNSGLATGPEFDNAADKGGNLNAQETSRGFYGRPLSNAEVKAATYKAQALGAALDGRQSVFQRYLAIDNPDSLLTKMGTDLSAHFSMSFFADLVDIGAKIFSPLKQLANLFGSLSPQLAMADSSADNQNYGIVQWGWSNAEEDLIRNNPSYFPLENQKILEDSGQSDAIAQKYGFCFDLNVHMGDMLTGDHPMITRADNGDVTNDGLCSPANLTYTNNEFGPGMVFRWRLEKAYEVTLDQLENMQTVSDSGTGAAAASSSGYVNPLKGVSHLQPARIDMGVDYSGFGPIYALGDGTVANLTNSGWPSPSTFISYKLSSGPAQGKYVYVAENCINIKVHVGQTIHAGDTLCDLVDAFPDLEIGWAQPPGLGDTIAVHNGGYVEGKATAAGENFNQLLVSLGAPSGTQQPQMGSLPPGWPTW